jgi:hypothetical protein
MLRMMNAQVGKSARNTDVWFVLIVVCASIPILAKGSVTGLIAIFGLLIWAILPTALKLPMLRHLWITATLWSAAQAVSNYAHEQYYMTFLIYVGVTIALFASGLYWIHETVGMSITTISIAVGIGWIGARLATGVLDTSNPWKYGLATPIAITVIAYAYHKRASRRVIALIFIALAITSRVYDNRMQTGLFALAAAAVLLISDDPERQRNKAKMTLAVLAAMVAVVYVAYPSAADDGLFGDRAMLQQQRDDLNDANFLLSIRKELPLTVYLAAQNPTLGIGSYTRISRQESAEALAFVRTLTGPINPSEQVYLTGGLDDRSGYKAHSQAVSSVLFAGVLASPFWIWLLFQCWKALLSIARGRALVPGLMFYMVGVVMWDLLFSPMNNTTHLTVGFLIFLVAAGAHTVAKERTNEVTARPNPGLLRSEAALVRRAVRPLPRTAAQPAGH